MYSSFYDYFGDWLVLLGRVAWMIVPSLLLTDGGTALSSESTSHPNSIMYFV